MITESDKLVARIVDHLPISETDASHFEKDIFKLIEDHERLEKELTETKAHAVKLRDYNVELGAKLIESEALRVKCQNFLKESYDSDMAAIPQLKEYGLEPSTHLMQQIEQMLKLSEATPATALQELLGNVIPVLIDSEAHIRVSRDAHNATLKNADAESQFYGEDIASTPLMNRITLAIKGLSQYLPKMK